MSRYPPLPEHLAKSLAMIEPSRFDDLLYCPCKVILTDGTSLDTVYVQQEDDYLKTWGVYPEDDIHKYSIRVTDVRSLESSPTRLPARFATKIYDGGESGMGVNRFVVLFADGTRQAYVSGNAVDFIPYPPGKGPRDVVGVMPHDSVAPVVDALQWYWCLYSNIDH